MKIAEKLEKAFHYLLPSPFTIAVLLTLLSMVLAYSFGKVGEGFSGFSSMMAAWQDGLWNPPLLVFALQMMLILVLGHTLALAPAIDRGINYLIGFASSATRAAVLVTFFTLIAAFLNWGLGLIFGAIIARKTGEKFSREGRSLNYPLIGAAGYSGLMIWHGGLSGSAPIKVVEAGHLQQLMEGIFSGPQLAQLPQSIPLSATVFSAMNITVTLLLLLMLPLVIGLLARYSKAPVPQLSGWQPAAKSAQKFKGADQLDHSPWFAWLFSGIIIATALYLSFSRSNFFTPDYINFCLLGLAIFFHGSFARFVQAVESAIGGSAGILIQFPFYFGIMALMKSSGLISNISDFFISISSETSFPIFTFFSAGLVNIFVPSGGGQWAVQGPIIIEAATKLGISLPKGIMALAYGDELTNMLQPFWALPLLGITGLKAREILPYTLILMLCGALVFLSLLLLF